MKHKEEEKKKATPQYYTYCIWAAVIAVLKMSTTSPVNCTQVLILSQIRMTEINKKSTNRRESEGPTSFVVIFSLFISDE